ALSVVGAVLLTRRTPFSFPRQWGALAGFVAAAALLPACSGSVSSAHWPNVLGLLSGLALFIATPVALAEHPDARRASLILLVATGACCAAVVLMQAAGLRWLTSDSYTGLEFRAPGTFGNPNWAAAFLAALVPLSLALARTTERRRLYHGIAGLLSIAAVATVSKGGAAALVAGLLVYVGLDRALSKKWRNAMVVGVAASVVLALAVAWKWELFATAPWLKGRLFLWRAALHLVSEQPLTGVGLGGYPAAYGHAAAALVHGDASAFIPLSSIDFAHNDLLQYAAEAGVVTAALFVLVLVSALVQAYRSNDPCSRAVGAAVSVVFVHGLVDAPMRVPSTFVLFFFLLGYLVPASQRATPRWLVFVPIVLLGAFQGVRFTAGNTYWTRGRDALRAGRPAARPLERAQRLLPEHGRSASQLARALARAGRIDDALAAAGQAAALRFDFDDEIFRLDLRARSLDREGALRAWREFSARFPMLVTPYLRLGALYLQANDRAAAIAAYESVLANPQPTRRAEAARAQARQILPRLLAKPLPAR
ncbi:MAG TPA: O-antigen ligase family protein, partial [Polyangiaceae bacterium]|nr:O-antigen ligase family protein [Polyangiaceae bacterium]